MQVRHDLGTTRRWRKRQVKCQSERRYSRRLFSPLSSPPWSCRSACIMPKAQPTIASPSPTRRRPQGSHWYYRVDQAGNRRCWFLALEGTWPRQALSPKPAPNPPPKRASQPKATATAQPASEMDPAATYAMVSPALPTSANVVDGERVSASNGAAGGLAATHPEDDMPLIGPVLSATELAAAEWPPGLAASRGPCLLMSRPRWRSS